MALTNDFLVGLDRPLKAAAAANWTISSETVFSLFAEEVERDENQESFIWLDGLDVTSESESLELELALALELELDELDDDEYRRDFDLRFFEPFKCFRADFFEDSSILRFFPALTAEQFSGKFLLGGCITGLFSRELFEVQ